MSNEPVIRKMRLSDWERFHEISTDIFGDEEIKEDWFARRIDQGGFFALEVGGHLSGMLFVAPFGDDGGYIQSVGVAREQQGKGYGKLLMEHALEWFKSKGTVRYVHLFTQESNATAQGLYTQFGFKVGGTTWHYFVPFNSLTPQGNFTCQKILEEEIDSIGDRHNDILPATQIRRFITRDEQLVLTLKDKKGTIIGVTRYSPKFPGCFSFIIDNMSGFDDFISGLQQFSLPEFDYSRVTFTDYPELAKICENRGYKLHHRLFKMTLNLEER